MKFINYELKNKIGTITLNRPEVHNAFNDELISELTKLVREISSDQNIRLVILKGNGKSFCAGADLNWMKSMKDYSLEENIEDSKKLSDLFYELDNLPVPLIGLINGHALGGGVGLVSVCDYVIASAKAKFGFTEVKLGLVPAVISPYVLNKIGAANARAYFLSGDVFTSSIALKMNLVQKICEEGDLERELETTVLNFLKAAPRAARSAKKLIKDVSSMTEGIREYTYKVISERRISEEGQEGMSALLEKRNPNWN